MPYVDRDGVRIHYEVEGEGPPLFLHHGFTGNLRRFYDHGYVAALRDRYRLILMDARGHGDSDKPHSSTAYGQRAALGDILAVLDACDVERTHYFGYSMGGRMGFTLARDAPERLCSLIVGGAHPYTASDDRGLFMSRVVRAAQFQREHIGGPLHRRVLALAVRPAARRRFRRQGDLDALAAMSRAGRAERTSFHDMLPGMTVPTLLFGGEFDQTFPAGAVAHAADVIPGARFVLLPGQDHGTAFRRSDLILPEIMEFLAAQTAEPRPRE